MGGLNKGSKDAFAEAYGACGLVLGWKKLAKPLRVGARGRKIRKEHSRSQG